MKLTKDRLKQIIKEELEEMMGQDPTIVARAPVDMSHLRSALIQVMEKSPNLNNEINEFYANLVKNVDKNGIINLKKYKDGTAAVEGFETVKMSKNLVDALKGNVNIGV